MSTFDQCRFKYKLRYVDKVKPELATTVEAFMGKMVHNTLERHYELVEKSRILTEEEMLEVYNEYWKRGWDNEIRINNKDLTAENYRQTGERCLKNYYARNQPFDDGITLGLEKIFFLKM